MTTAVTTSKPQGTAVAPPDRVEANIALMADKFRPLLTSQEETERFCRVAVNAVQQTKGMDEVVATQEGRQSIYDACLQAATDRLLLDKKQSALVIYNEKMKDAQGKEQWRKVAKYMPMVQGLMHLAYEGGVVKRIVCQIVHALDKFAVMPTAEGCPLAHEFPDDPFADRGAIRGVYAVAQYHDGTWSDAQVMSVADVENIRKRSKQATGSTWNDNWPEMARKTAIRRLNKYLPKTGGEHFSSAAQRIDADYDMDTPLLPAPERKEPMAQKLLADAKPKESPPEKPAEKKAEAKTEKKAKRQDDGGPPPMDDDGPWDERGGGQVIENDEDDGDDPPV